MIIDHPRILTIAALGALALIGSFERPPAEQYERPDFLKVQSVQGGFELKAPKSWSLSEDITETSYDAFLCEGSGPPHTATFFFRFQRSKDYHALFDIDPKKLDESSFKYMTTLAFGMTPHNAPMLYERDRMIVGVRSKRYFVDAGLGTKDCLRGYVELGVSGTEGLLVTGRIPCSDSTMSFDKYMTLGPASPERLFLEMADSVRILRRWGKGA